MNSITVKYRPAKCPICEQSIDRNIEPFIEKSNRFLHEECHKQQQAKTQPRRDLIEYICHLHNIKIPTGYILKQIKDFEDNHGFTPAGIRMTLHYFHEIRENEVINGTGIGIVEYVYESAKEYFATLSDVFNHNKNIEIDNTEEIIYASPPKIRKIKQIDLEDIF